MHGTKDTLLCWLELSPTCFVAFEQHPTNPTEMKVGVTHPGNSGGSTTAGTMHHFAMNIDSLEDLYAMRDRIRSKGIPVIGPIFHGFCYSIYFAGHEGLALEIAYKCGPLDPADWVDPAALAKAGISAAELEKFKTPDVYVRPAKPVPQPGPDAPGPHQVYPPSVYKKLLAIPDEKMLHSVESTAPNKASSKL